MTDFALPRPRPVDKNESALRAASREQVRVLWALMLHDIKSRFFGNGLGYVLTIVWPSVHIAIIVAIYVLSKRPVPYGNSAFLYASTGVLPYIAWNYVSRFMMMSVMQNKAFMSYPVIRLLDLLLARAALETISIFIICLGLIFALTVAGVDFMPISPILAVEAIGASLFLGFGFGMLNSVILMIAPLWFIGYVGILILFWITAGLAFDPEALPFELAYWISWNPLMHCIEWLRSAYYPTFPGRLLDKAYVLETAFFTMTLGFVAERVLKPFFKT